MGFILRLTHLVAHSGLRFPRKNATLARDDLPACLSGPPRPAYLFDESGRVEREACEAKQEPTRRLADRRLADCPRTPTHTTSKQAALAARRGVVNKVEAASGQV